MMTLFNGPLVHITVNYYVVNSYENVSLKIVTFTIIFVQLLLILCHTSIITHVLSNGPPYQ